MIDKAYHYTGLETALKILKVNEKNQIVLRAFRYDTMDDDKEDCVYASKVVLPRLKDALAKSDLPESEKECVNHVAYLSCFSGLRDDARLWNHFPHTSVCLVFDAHVIKKNERVSKGDREYFEYEFEQCHYPPEDRIKECHEKILANRDNVYDRQWDNAQMSCFVIKPPEHEEESEWRIIKPVYPGFYGKVDKPDETEDADEIPEPLIDERGKKYQEVTLPHEALIGVIVYTGRLTDKDKALADLSSCLVENGFSKSMLSESRCGKE